MQYRSAWTWTSDQAGDGGESLDALLAAGTPPMVARIGTGTRADSASSRIRRVAGVSASVWSIQAHLEDLVISPAGPVTGSLLIYNAGGRVDLRGDSGRDTLLAGDLYLISRARALRLSTVGRFDIRLYALAEPVSWRDGPLPGDEAGLRALGGDPLTDLAAAALRSVDALAETLPDPALRELLRHACSLVALQGAPASGEIRNARSARLAQAKTLIHTHFRDAKFDPDCAARILGCSVRYLHLLFAPTGTSFGQHLMTRRLQAAKAALEEEAPGGRAITDIAYDCGFNDLSTFNRSFRRAFGMTPRDARMVASLATSAHALDPKLLTH